MPADVDKVSPEDLEAVRKTLDASGFPLQTAVAAISRKSGWGVVREEVPWSDATGADQFLDLVANHRASYLTIECKKTEKERYTFLLPYDKDRGPRGESYAARLLFAVQIDDSTRRLELKAGSCEVTPESQVSKLCVVGTDVGGKNQRLIERDGRLLLGGTDSFAISEKRRLNPTAEQNNLLLPLVFLPILVTNAQLYTAGYDPATDISLETAHFEKAADLQPVPWIRFEKSFGLSQGQYDLGDRTIFVVQAKSLAQFLGRVEVSGRVVLDGHLPSPE